MTDTMTIRELQDYLNGRAGETLSDPAEYARASAAYFAVDRLLAEREELVGALAALTEAYEADAGLSDVPRIVPKRGQPQAWGPHPWSDARALLSRLGG